MSNTGSFNEKEKSHASDWLGLVVDKIDKSDLMWVKQQGYTKWRELPVEFVRLPVDDLSTVAVLSWRWDIDEEDHPSRNILSAILQAKQMGVQHLFVDVVSIDQRLTGDDLLNRVVEFSMLYRTIPVIAAYDKIGSDFGSTMRRPWISNELQAYRTNPTKIVYVGHNDQGAGLGRPNLPVFASKSFQRKLPTDVSKFRFSGFAELIWRSSFATTLMMVLKGTIGMQSISDLKYIMPAYAPILTRAYGRMSRNDYLLTAAILAQQESFTAVVNDTDSSDNLFYPKKASFTFYSFKAIYNTMKEDAYEVLVNGNTVGRWHVRHNYYYDDAYYIKLYASENTDQAICTALGMTDFEYESYLTGKRNWQVDDQIRAPLPEIEVVSVSIELGNK